MSPETFTSHVRQYCAWVESDTHDAATVHRLLLALLEGAPGLKTATGQQPEREAPGLPQEVRWTDTKRFADFPFQCYKAILWPDEEHAEGSFTENIHLDFLHIYEELRHGLQFMEAGDVTGAITYWRNSCFFHWGHHASAAVWAIEFEGLAPHPGELAAAPNGGPAERHDDSRAGGGPPSVS